MRSRVAPTAPADERPQNPSALRSPGGNYLPAARSREGLEGDGRGAEGLERERRRSWNLEGIGKGNKSIPLRFRQSGARLNQGQGLVSHPSLKNHARELYRGGEMRGGHGPIIVPGNLGPGGAEHHYRGKGHEDQSLKSTSAVHRTLSSKRLNSHCGTQMYFPESPIAIRVHGDVPGCHYSSMIAVRRNRKQGAPSEVPTTALSEQSHWGGVIPTEALRKRCVRQDPQLERAVGVVPHSWNEHLLAVRTPPARRPDAPRIRAA